MAQSGNFFGKPHQREPPSRLVLKPKLKQSSCQFYVGSGEDNLFVEGCHKTNFNTRPASRAMPPLQEMQQGQPLSYQEVRHFPPRSATILHPTKNLPGQRREASMVDHDAELCKTEEAYRATLEGQLKKCERFQRRPGSACGGYGAPVRSWSAAGLRSYGPAGQNTFKKSAHMVAGNVSRHGGHHQNPGFGDGVVFGSEVLVQWLEKNAGWGVGSLAASTY